MAGMAGHVLCDPLRRFRVQLRSCAEQRDKEGTRVTIRDLKADPQDLGVTFLDDSGHLAEGQEIGGRCQRGQPDSHHSLNRRPARHRCPGVRDEVGPRQPFRAGKSHGRQAPHKQASRLPLRTPSSPSRHGPGRVVHKLGYNSRRVPCRDCLDPANIMLAVPAQDLPAGRHMTCARRRVLRTRSACIWSQCWQRCPALGALGLSCYRLEHLISATRRIKRSDHVGYALLLAIEALNFSDTRVKRSDSAG